MTDTLRDRIAAVLWKHRACNPTTPVAYYLDHADELIRELGLRREDLGGFRVPGYGHRGYRYVTDWTADD